ncbi:hypothetical protein Gorai_012432 [Gossypium raimondii]|uniref:Uncharacterized protein n=1 Tax=Gossypium raimondii TaxID=29730 RepID=A0A7J8Q236_GOSRA|nr:hypothetical protein [Gossypium raimondii]
MSNGMRRVWTGLATRLGVRKSGKSQLSTVLILTRRQFDDFSKAEIKKGLLFSLPYLLGEGTGLLKLQKEVSSCEYGDVHVMWELLRRSEIEMGESPKRCKKRRLRKCFQWRRSPFHRRCFS